MIKYQCPTCREEVIYSKENTFRPFCSKRCKLIDLGEWASEGHKISGARAKDVMFSEELEAIIKNGGIE